MKIAAYAKVNLSLDVLKKRGDGYHDLRMVAQTVSLCDDIEIDLSDDRSVTAECNLSYIPIDERNLAVAAAKLFFEKTGLSRGAHISITKRIPVCAGLGGGSSDAAAVLRGLNAMLDTRLSTVELCELAGLLGSDVPFCIDGGTQLMEGRGEILTPLAPLPECYIVICKPKAAMSTQTVFSWVNTRSIKYHPDNTGMIKALAEGKVSDVGRRMYNVLEDIVAKKTGDIPLIRGELLDGGATGACMTGSGTAVIGMFENHESAEKSAETLLQKFPETFLTIPVSYV